MNIHSDRIGELRKLMRSEGIELYYIPMSDCHGSEYVSDHFRCIEYLTGFTGSAGHLLVSDEGAWLFADGRYHIQAACQLSGSDITLIRWGLEGEPEPAAFIRDKADGKILGFDGNVVNARFAEKISAKASGVKYKKDLVDVIWTDRPEQNFTDIWDLPDRYTGESSEDKLERVRRELETIAGEAADYTYLLNSPEDIAWIFNIRANDIPNNPVAYAYAAVTKETAAVYTRKNGYSRKWYEDEGIANTDLVIMDLDRICYDTYRYFQDSKKQIIDAENPSVKMKAVKNKTEITCLKSALLRDSAVIIRFMYWIKKNAGRIYLDEVSVNEYLMTLRQEDPLFIEPSFDTIAAYKENAAMMHYEATPETAGQIYSSGMLLLDSGGQYMDGTTDITRTFVLGPVSDEEKKSFTLTAVSMLRLMNAKFIEGCRGENLDILARGPMWNEGMDYKCSTGHGVGHVLNVHEGPQAVRYRINDRGPSAVLKEGMVVTDEPGVYREGKYGVRTENELLVVPYMETPEGRFLQFENLTFVPIDLDGIDKQYLTDDDKKLLNKYHRMVYDKTEGFFDKEIKDWLAYYTREID